MLAANIQHDGLGGGGGGGGGKESVSLADCGPD